MSLRLQVRVASPFTLNQDLSTGERVTVELDASKTFLERHRVTIGTETRIKLKADQSNYNETPYLLIPR